MLDDRAVVLVRFYREAAANGELLPIEKNSHPKTKMYHLPLTNDGYKFEWVQANSALCNAQMTKMQRLIGIRRTVLNDYWLLFCVYSAYFVVLCGFVKELNPYLIG